MSTSRRRKAVKQDSQDTTDLPTKKIKKEPLALDSNNNVNGKSCSKLSPTWEYESGKDKWIQYTCDQNKELSGAFKDGKGSIEITQNKSTIVVIFDRMVQRNVKSGFEKRVRCLSLDDDEQCKAQSKEAHKCLLPF
ncbi:hypothetical protein AC249_AIPGENE16430 [Exaiptasia diaphana]|nr:hypothetical protein AC249_AIPGENE16430 [Exaiptasia diaphana]